MYIKSFVFCFLLLSIVLPSFLVRSEDVSDEEILKELLAENDSSFGERALEKRGFFKKLLLGAVAAGAAYKGMKYMKKRRQRKYGGGGGAAYPPQQQRRGGFLSRLG
ncbi:hypothetical protein SNEBB_004542 [Seison nebaliae]|nr:hypothetical protein SNEBB_004542 [Seison nebaliae]